MTRFSLSRAAALAILLTCASVAWGQPVLTGGTLPQDDVGTLYPTQQLVSGGTPPYTWNIISGSPPAGINLNSDGSLSGTPTASGASTFTATVTDSASLTSNQATISITIVAAPVISPVSLPVQDAGGYSQTLSATGGIPNYTWSFTGSLPTGTSLNSSTGAISGSASSGVYNFTVTVTDSVGGSGSQAYTVMINPLPVVAAASLPNGEVSAVYSTQTLSASGGSGSYTWSISSGALPGGLSLSSGGQISGIPTTTSGSPFNFTAEATDSLGGFGTQSFTITIIAAPVVTAASLPNGEVGAVYSTQTLTASGGSGSYTWSISSGALPGGLSLSSGGQISGTPTSSSGSPFNFTAKATDSAGGFGTQSFTITVIAGPSITTASPLPAGDAGATYGQTLTASGGSTPYTWSVTSGSLGALSLSSAGVISGTPSAGTYTFTVKVTDTAGGSGTQAYSLTINAAMNIATTTLPAGDNGKFYSQTLAVTGGTSPFTWSVASGSLGPLSLSSAGVISGTPTTGTLHFTVQVTDSASPPTTATSQALTITINGTLSITTTSLSAGDQGSAYSQTLAATGGTTPYTWSVTPGSLPTGVTLNASTGVISGTPSVQGAFSIPVTVTDSIGATAQQTFNLTIHAPLSITTPPTLANGAVGVAYSQTLSATGGATPYAWSVISGSLGQLSLNGSTGAITGTPNGAATLTFTVQLTDAILATTTKQFSITIVSGLTITNAPTLPGGEVNAPYSQTLTAAGGTPPYTWSITTGSQPNGVTLNASTGVLSGTPQASGPFTFTVKVTDNASVTATQQFSLTINSLLTITTAPSLPGGSVGASYSQAIGVSGGVSPYHFSITAGALPAGLSLDPSSGTISGTPSSSGNFSFTVQVIDSASVTASKQFTLALVQGLNITTAPTLPGGSVGTSYSAPLNVSGGTAPYSWLISAGALPAGLSLNPATGTIAGTPTSAGAFTFTVQVTDSASLKATKQFALAIGTGLAITTPSPLPSGSTAAPYSVTLLATGGTPPLRWSLSSGTLPPGVTLGPTGIIGGTPTSPGTFTFSVNVTDNTSLVASQTYSLTISSGLVISTPQLPNGSVNTSYLQTLTAAGGTAPYTWAVTVGALPSGLSLISSSGVIGGKPSVNGTFTFTVKVTDLTGATASKQFSLNIASGLTINSNTLPSGILTQQYSALAGAPVGGTQPYTWKIGGGALPPGLSLNPATGAIAGTPTSAGVFNFTLQVTDSNGATASQAFTISVLPPNLPQITVAGVPETSTAAQQIDFNVTLASAYSLDITGSIAISFAPDAVASADDPAIQFSTGGRTVSFTIPANTTNAIFSTPQIALQTGTVAGTITLTFALQAGGADLPAIPDHSIAIARSAPVITNVAVVTSSNGFQIQVTGYSTPRELTEADVKFTAAAGASLTTTSVTESLTTVGSQWFQSAGSVQYGSQFVLVLPFTASQGNIDAVASVTVTLKNSTGASPSSSANF
jgi:large repetitive protein